jgi:hypothetical protein
LILSLKNSFWKMIIVDLIGILSILTNCAIKDNNRNVCKINCHSNGSLLPSLGKAKHKTPRFLKKNVLPSSKHSFYFVVSSFFEELVESYSSFINRIVFIVLDITK